MTTENDESATLGWFHIKWIVHQCYCRLLSFAILGITNAVYSVECRISEISPSVCGAVISTLAVACCIAIPLVGFILIRRPCMVFPGYLAGIATSGVGCVLFGVSRYATSNSVFVALSLLFRVTLGVGDALFWSAADTILTDIIPYDRIGTVLGVAESFSAGGMLLGPLIGAVLYQHVDYKTPFILVGAALLIAAIPGPYCLVFSSNGPTHELSQAVIDEQSRPKHRNTQQTKWNYLKHRSVVIVCLNTCVNVGLMSFAQASLAPYLMRFKYTETQTGLILSVPAIGTLIIAPIFGNIVDRVGCCKLVMSFASASGVFALLLMGPCPILKWKPSWTTVILSMLLLAVNIGAMQSITIKEMLRSATVQHDVPHGLEIQTFIIALFGECWMIGVSLGPFLGGFGVDGVGFPWAASIGAVVMLIQMVVLAVQFVCETRQTNRSDEQMLEKLHLMQYERFEVRRRKRKNDSLTSCSNSSD